MTYFIGTISLALFITSLLDVIENQKDWNKSKDAAQTAVALLAIAAYCFK